MLNMLRKSLSGERKDDKDCNVDTDTAITSDDSADLSDCELSASSTQCVPICLLSLTLTQGNKQGKDTDWQRTPIQIRLTNHRNKVNVPNLLNKKVGSPTGQPGWCIHTEHTRLQLLPPDGNT